MPFCSRWIRKKSLSRTVRKHIVRLRDFSHIDFSHGRDYTYLILMSQGDFHMYIFIFSRPIWCQFFRKLIKLRIIAASFDRLLFDWPQIVYGKDNRISWKEISVFYTGLLSYREWYFTVLLRFSTARKRDSLYSRFLLSKAYPFSYVLFWKFPGESWQIRSATDPLWFYAVFFTLFPSLFSGKPGVLQIFSWSVFFWALLFPGYRE